MTIRRIKADAATEDGDYIRIERRSRRGFTTLVGVLLGVLICWFISVLGYIYPNQEIVLLIVVIMSMVAGFFLDEGQVVRRVPKIDLVEIKRYAWPPGVTVVFDDERIMRGHRGGRKDDDDDS